MVENQNKPTTLVSIQVKYCDKICIAKYNENTKIQLKNVMKELLVGGGDHKMKEIQIHSAKLGKLWMVNNKIRLNDI